MKNINSFIFEKLQLNKQTQVGTPWNDSFEEFCSTKDNLTIKDTYLEELDASKYVSNKAPYHRAESSMALYYVNSFKYGYEYALDLKEKDKDKYDYIFFLIKFDNFKLAFHVTNYNDLYIYAIGPKEINIKSLVSGSRSIFNICGNLYLNDKTCKDVNAVIDDTYDEIIKLKKDIIDKYYTSLIDHGSPSSDISPFNLRKNRKFPNYIKHCIVKGSDNDVVKKHTWDEQAEIFVQTVEKNGKKYYKVLMGDVNGSFNTGQDETSVYYLISLGQLDKFLEYTLRPQRRKKTSWVGADGDMHYGSTPMNKSLPQNLKKDLIKDENLIKTLKFKHMDIYELYK